MKRCPEYGRTFNDETLRFCLYDSKPLTGDTPPGPALPVSAVPPYAVPPYAVPLWKVKGNRSFMSVRVQAVRFLRAPGLLMVLHTAWDIQPFVPRSFCICLCWGF